MFDIITKNKTVNKVILIPVEDIEANQAQPRKIFSTPELLELSNSIRENGILQPITLRKNQDKFTIVAGERRLRAAVLAGFEAVPSIILDIDEKEAAVLSVIENLQRKDLSFFEEAFGYNSLLKKLKITQEQLAKKLGKSQSCVANKIRLLKFSDKEMIAIIKADLTERHARALLKLDSIEERLAVIDVIVKKSLNVAQTEEVVLEYIEKSSEETRKKIKKFVFLKDLRIFYNTVDKAVDFIKSAGIDIVSERKEVGDNIELKIVIPKTMKKLPVNNNP